MRQFRFFFIALVAVGLFAACTRSDDERATITSPTALYAIIKSEGAQLIDINKEDYVLTLDNIIAANPETGEFKLRNTEQIDSKAFPIPTQYVIAFYNEGTLLFEAYLNSVISSYLPNGLLFEHCMTDKNGLAKYTLVTMKYTLVTSIGNSSEEQEIGIRRMYEILQKAGKISKKLDFEFEF